MKIKWLDWDFVICSIKNDDDICSEFHAHWAIDLLVKDKSIIIKSINKFVFAHFAGSQSDDKIDDE